MKTFGKNFSIIFLFGLVACCTSNIKSKETIAKDFILPVVPEVINSQQEALKYISKNYWNDFDFSDSLAYSKPTESIFFDFVQIVRQLDLNDAAKSVENMITKAQIDSLGYARIVALCEKYFHNPNSPYRNDELYIPVLKNILETNIIKEENKTQFGYQLEMAMKNRVGEVACNFIYTTISGKKGSMHNIKSSYILLFINNPGCRACSEYVKEIGNSQIISNMLRNNKLTILAIYPDIDLDEWKKHKDKIPANWINAEATELLQQNMYDLKAMPTIYLLGKDKKVILKDVYVKDVENYFFKVLNERT